MKKGNCYLTQEEAHAVFEYPALSVTIATQYIQVTALMLFTVFYIFFMPIGAVFTLFTLFVVYWIDKVTFPLHSLYFNLVQNDTHE
jgi:hypothetical protein